MTAARVTEGTICLRSSSHFATKHMVGRELPIGPDEKRDDLIAVCGVVGADYDRFIGNRHSSPSRRDHRSPLYTQKRTLLTVIGMSAKCQKQTFRPGPRRGRRGVAVRRAVNLPFWLSKIASGLLCSKTIEQPVTAGAAQIILAAAAVRPSRRMRRIP